MSLYLDASVIVPTLVQEDSSAAVLTFLTATNEELLVSEYAAAEVASAVARLVRMGELTAAAGNGRLGRFDAWRAADTTALDIDNLDIAEAGALVRRFELKLRTPDALHLVVSGRASAPLVTLDGGLASAAQTLGIPVRVL